MIYTVYVYDKENHNVISHKTNDIEGYEGLSNVAINPDLAAVKGYKREHWKIVDGKCLNKTHEERLESDRFHEAMAKDTPMVIKVPVEVVKEVEVIKEVIKEVPVEIIKEVVKEIPVEVVEEVFIDKHIIEYRIPKSFWFIPLLACIIGYFIRGVIWISQN